MEDLFSKRNSPSPDVYIYDKIPHRLRNQIYHIWKKFFLQKQFNNEMSEKFWEHIGVTLAEAHGLKSLNDGIPHFEKSKTSFGKLVKYFENTRDVKHVIDVIEYSFRVIENSKNTLQGLGYGSEFGYSPSQSIKDLNGYFKENGVGYQFEKGLIIKFESELLHNDVTVPALNLLSDPQFKNANDEFLKAHTYFKNDDQAGCLNECLKAFETTMKIICELNKWQYDKEKDTSNKLLQICFDNNLIPQYLQSHYTGLLANLKSGIPTIRNRESGHGKGVETSQIPDCLVNYMLNLTGASIKFFIEAYHDFKKS